MRSERSKRIVVPGRTASDSEAVHLGVSLGWVNSVFRLSVGRGTDGIPLNAWGDSVQRLLPKPIVRSPASRFTVGGSDRPSLAIAGAERADPAIARTPRRVTRKSEPPPIRRSVSESGIDSLIISLHWREPCDRCHACQCRLSYFNRSGKHSLTLPRTMGLSTHWTSHSLY